jgi:hypothetical protein
MAMIGGAIGTLVGMGVCEELALKNVGWECDEQRSFLRYESHCTGTRVRSIQAPDGVETTT